MAITKIALSGSTNGRGIIITGTASGSANTIHTAVSGTSALDEVYLWVASRSASAATLTVLYGGTSTSDEMTVEVPNLKAGPLLIVPGLVLNNGAVIKAFCGTGGSLLNVFGYAHRIV